MRIEIFKTKDNKYPFKEWIGKLDKTLRYRIYQRLSRVEEGNFGDHKNLKDGLFELRFHFDNGLRVYYAKQVNKVVILLCAGNKRSQGKDIKLAKEYLKKLMEKT